MEREWPVSFKALLDGFDATILMSMATIELLAKAKGAALEQHFDALMVRRDADEWESFLAERKRRRALNEQREIERARRRAEKLAWEEERGARREAARSRRASRNQFGNRGGGHGGLNEEDFIEMMFARRFGAFHFGGHGFPFGGGGHGFPFGGGSYFHYFDESDDEDDDYWEREREKKAREARETTRKSTEILGVDEDATTREIKSAYRAKARLFHPDKWHLNRASTGLTREQTVDHFQKLQEAYEYLATEN